jgi:hypothetical protein
VDVAPGGIVGRAVVATIVGLDIVLIVRTFDASDTPISTVNLLKNVVAFTCATGTNEGLTAPWMDVQITPSEDDCH